MSIPVVLIVAAVICLILSVLGRLPLWVSVLLLILSAAFGLA